MSEGEHDLPTELVVFRCEDCGDTFPTHGGDDVTCPSCGGRSVQRAHEPLL